MAVLEQRDPRFKGLEKKVGVFASVVLLMLLAIFFFMAKERGIFIKKYTLFFTVGSGSGFIEGMPVKLLGFKIGNVKSLALTEDARVKVTLEINEKYQKWIREGAVARLLKEGVIGDALVEITVGPSSGRIIEDGGELAYEKVSGIEELAKEIKPVLQEVKDTFSYINNPEGDIKSAIANIRMLSEGLLQTKRSLDAVLKEVKGTVNEATSALEKLGNIGEKALPVVDKLNTVASDAEKASKKIPEVVSKVDRVVDDVSQISGALSRKSSDIKDILEDAQDTLVNTKEIVKGVKGSWPVNSLIPPKEELKLIPLDGSGKEQ